MNGQKRTDKILITVALLILLMATGMFYFDGWMWGSRKSRGERIGFITNRTGDVRMKFEDDLKWQKASAGTDLEYNDAVYAGAGAQAKLQIGNSQMTVSENTLVVLRRDQNVNFLNLNYGSLFGSLAKNEKVIIDTGNGKPIELMSSKNAQIFLRRQNGKTQLDVTSGEASVTINGKTSRVDKSSRLVFGDKTPALLKTNHLHIEKPLRDQYFVSENPTQIDFSWAWDNSRSALRNERYTVEFSTHPNFSKIHALKSVDGQLSTSMTVSQSLSLFFRVKGPEGQISAPEKVNFLRLEKPLILAPLANSKIPSQDDLGAMVGFEFHAPQKASVIYQIAADDKFERILVNRATALPKAEQQLAAGEYFLRARGDFGKGHLTSWTDSRAFKVSPLPEILPLAKRHLPTKILIPNVNYPRALYGAPSEQVQGFLAQRGLLQRYLPFHESEMDEMKLQMQTGKGESYTLRSGAWPEQNLKPGRYGYRFQATKKGYRPSNWSSVKSLEIGMEPPRPVGEATYGELKDDGQRQATWHFTPLLFANSYDVEISPDPDFTQSIQFKTRQALVEARIPQGDYYWRSRARDSQGRIISSFSRPYQLKPMPDIPPPLLAREEPPIREPAAVQTSTTKIERIHDQAWERSGWWAWLGTGENYVDYKQSLPGTGALSSHGIKGGSQYFEGGYLAGNGLGGIVSYKNTPGQFSINEVPVVPSTYRWTTVSAEGLVRQTSKFTVFDHPIVYGLRAGLQQHQMPFLSLSDDATVIYLKNNHMTAGSVGLMAEYARSRWTYYWSMRYQVPLTTQADGAAQFSNTPVFAFDGSLGTSYNFTQRLKAGFFWYGQWHQMNFEYSDGTVLNSGFQSLFSSSMDLRLGFDF